MDIKFNTNQILTNSKIYLMKVCLFVSNFLEIIVKCYK